MSRIFDALQRSESVRTGIEVQEPETLATDILQVPEKGNEQTSRIEEFTQVSIVPGDGTRLISLTDPESLAAEKFRFLGVRLRQAQQNRGLKKLLITSTLAEEGKSMVSANLAFTLARKKRQKVLLIDGDLRRPVLASRLGLGRMSGLVEWLHGEGTPAPPVYRLAETGVCLLPAGNPPENPLELIQLPKLVGLLEKLSTWFDWIVIDSPPVLPLADTSVWARLCDAILLVAREGTSQRRELKRGIEALDKKKLLGMVVNSCTDADHTNYYQRYGPASSQAQRAAE